MRLALGLLLAVALAAPASAAAPPPTILDFEDQPVDTRVFDLYLGHPELAFSDGDSCGSVQATGGNFGPQYLETGCNPITIEFREPQAVVSLYAIATFAPGRVAAARGPSPPTIEVHTFDRTGQPIASVPVDATENTWTPVVVTSPSAAIGYVSVDTSLELIGVDDIGFSPVPQPDTEITSGPSGTVTNGEAAFGFVANQDRVTFACKLDSAPSELCASEKTYSGLADGTHTFTVMTIDRWGSVDATPATQTWTVRRTVPPSDRDADTVTDASDNCPDNANTGQGDGDKDGVGDVCEQLPPGTAPIEAGKATQVKLVSGEVFVKLPPGASAGAFTAGLRVPFQDGGFIPLKGVATVPLGSTLDTRKGQVALTAAINGQAAGNRRQLRREARFRAGIFAIRQARRSRKRSRKRKIPVRAEVVSASGAQARCARSAPGGGPLKGVTVRSLSMTAKGLFRAVGGAATAAPVKGSATFITTDRCDGTVTEVGRGRVAVVSKRTGRKRTVRVGQAYLVRARLFAARKGRPN